MNQATHPAAGIVDPTVLPLTWRSPLTEPWGPVDMRHTADAVELTLTIREAHCNARGFAHGGCIAGLADMAMGLSALHVARRQPGSGVTGMTLSLSLDFVDTARIGEVIAFRPTVLKVGKTIGFADCRVACGDRLIARASGSFRVLSARPADEHRERVAEPINP